MTSPGEARGKKRGHSATSAGFSVELEQAIASSYSIWLNTWPVPVERRHSDERSLDIVDRAETTLTR